MTDWMWTKEWNQRELTTWDGRHWGLNVNLTPTTFGFALVWSLSNLRWEDRQKHVGPTALVSFRIGPFDGRIWSFGFFAHRVHSFEGNEG